MLKKIYIIFFLLFSIGLQGKTLNLNSQNIQVDSIQDDGYNSQKAILTRDTVIHTEKNMITLKGGAPIIYDVKNKYITHGILLKNTSITTKTKPLTLKGGTPITFLGDVHYKTKKLNVYIYKANLVKNTPINIGIYNVICSGGSMPKEMKYGNYDINLGMGGKINAVRLARDESLSVRGQKLVFQQGTVLSFQYGNKIEFGFLKKGQEITVGNQKIIVRDKKNTSNISFNTREGISTIDVVSGTLFTVGKRKIKCNRSKLFFYKNGSLKKADWLYPFNLVIGNKKFFIGGKYYITFHENGAVKSFMNDLKQEQIVNVGGQNISLRWKKYLVLYPDESLKECYLQKDTNLVVNGKKILVKKNQKLYFDQAGKIIKVK